jgi:hypothetical protein
MLRRGSLKGGVERDEERMGFSFRSDDDFLFQIYIEGKK